MENGFEGSLCPAEFQDDRSWPAVDDVDRGVSFHITGRQLRPFPVPVCFWNHFEGFVTSYPEGDYRRT